MTNKGKLIVFEGLDGSGKLTQFKILKKRFTIQKRRNISLEEIGKLFKKFGISTKDIALKE